MIAIHEYFRYKPDVRNIYKLCNKYAFLLGMNITKLLIYILILQFMYLLFNETILTIKNVFTIFKKHLRFFEISTNMIWFLLFLCSQSILNKEIVNTFLQSMTVNLHEAQVHNKDIICIDALFLPHCLPSVFYILLSTHEKNFPMLIIRW